MVLHTNGSYECNILCNCSNREDSTNGHWACKHQQTQQSCNCKDEPHAVNRCFSFRIDLAPPSATWNSSIPGVRKDDTRCADGTSLTNEKLSNDINRKHDQTRSFSENLYAKTCHRLAVWSIQDISNVFDSVSNNQDDSKTKVKCQ